jgi:MFS family permease
MVSHQEKKKLESNIWKMNVYMVLYGLLFFTPIMVLFYQDNGLSLTQIMLIQSFTSIIFFAFEVPSGYFADLYGRKLSLMLTGIFSSIAMLSFALGTNLYHFLVAASLWAMAGVFISGADSALLYDTLVDLQQEHKYKKHWGNVIYYYSLGMALASIVGGFLGKMDYRYPFYAMIPTMLCLVPLAFSFYEPVHHKATIQKNYLSGLYEALVNILSKNSTLMWLIAYAAVLGSFKTTAYFLYQPYFELSGLEISYFGIVFASFYIVAAFGSKQANYIEKKLGMNLSLWLPLILITLAYFLMGLVVFYFSFLFVFLIQFQKGLARIIVTDSIHKQIDSKHRATVLSVKSLSERLLFTVLSPFIGYLVDAFSLTQALIISGGLVALFGSLSLSLFFISKPKN